jgi:hypothetical protein
MRILVHCPKLPFQPLFAKGESPKLSSFSLAPCFRFY